MSSTPLPGKVQNLENVVFITTGYRHNFAQKSDGSVWAWGNNIYGQLGDGTASTWDPPIEVASLAGVMSISAGLNHSLALKSDGTGLAVGRNAYGQLGLGTCELNFTPVTTLFSCP